MSMKTIFSSWMETLNSSQPRLLALDNMRWIKETRRVNMKGENILFLNNLHQINFLVSGITGGGVYFQQTKHKTLEKNKHI